MTSNNSCRGHREIERALFSWPVLWLMTRDVLCIQLRRHSDMRKLYADYADFCLPFPFTWRPALTHSAVYYSFHIFTWESVLCPVISLSFIGMQETSTLLPKIVKPQISHTGTGYQVRENADSQDFVVRQTSFSIELRLECVIFVLMRLPSCCSCHFYNCQK